MDYKKGSNSESVRILSQCFKVHTNAHLNKCRGMLRTQLGPDSELVLHGAHQGAHSYLRVHHRQRGARCRLNVGCRGAQMTTLLASLRMLLLGKIDEHLWMNVCWQVWWILTSQDNIDTWIFRWWMNIYEWLDSCNLYESVWLWAKNIHIYTLNIIRRKPF